MYGYTVQYGNKTNLKSHGQKVAKFILFHEHTVGTYKYCFKFHTKNDQ